MTAAPFDRPIAHRGFHDRSSGVIENSQSAFEAAIAGGFGIECDLQLTSDGVPVVFHDEDTGRLLGRSGRVSTIDSGVLCATPLLNSSTGDCPQRFGEFLARIDGRAPLVVELKRQADPQRGRRLAQGAMEIARNYEGPLVFKSFDPHLLRHLREAGYRGSLGIVTYGYNQPEWDGELTPTQRFVLRNLLHWPWSRFTFISCEQSALGLPMVRLFKQTGMKVMSWTIRDKVSAGRALRGADQIVFEGFDPD